MAVLCPFNTFVPWVRGTLGYPIGFTGEEQRTILSRHIWARLVVPFLWNNRVV